MVKRNDDFFFFVLFFVVINFIYSHVSNLIYNYYIKVKFHSPNFLFYIII